MPDRAAALAPQQHAELLLHATGERSDETGDARAWLEHVARSQGGLTAESIAAALRRCHSMQLRRAILREISTRWGNTGVQQTLAAERRHATAEDAQRNSSAISGDAEQRTPHEHATPSRVAPLAGANPSLAIAAPSEDNTRSAARGDPARADASRASGSPDDGARGYASAIDRARALAQLGRAHLQAIDSVLIPAYRRAVAATDSGAVRALVLQLVGGIAHVIDAQAHIVRLVPQADTSPNAVQASSTDTDPFEPDASAFAALMLDKAVLDSALSSALPQLAVQLSPQMFGDQPTTGAIEPAPVSRHVFERLAYEADLVVKLLEEADRIQALILPIDAERGTSEPATDAARSDAMERAAHWRSRPINFLFLVRVLTDRGVWQAMQGAKDLRGNSAADLERKVAVQAAETGTTADVGQWDPEDARAALSYGALDWAVSGDEAMAVLEMLARAEPSARGGLVKQLHRMGLLSRMCENLPWGVVKELWESIDDPEVSRLLEPYWADRGGGESLGKMLDGHWYTRALSTFMDVTTFGAKSRIDAAYDAREAGLISDDDYWNAVNKAVGRAAFVGAAMVATGGIAGEFAAGAAAGFGEAGAAIVGSAAAGAVGNLGGHFAGDVYDQVLDGKQGFDSLSSYAKSFAEGGLVGTAVAPLALAASKYLPEAMRTMAQQAAVSHPEMTRVLEAARACGVGAATRVRMTVREFLESMRGSGPPPGFRLAYASAGGAAIPKEIASAPPESGLVLTVRPLQDLDAPAPMRSDNASGDLVEVEQVRLADQVSEAFEDASRGISEVHAPDDGGSFAGETSRLGEGAPEVDAISMRRTRRDAGVVDAEGQVHTHQHHVFPQGRARWFEERGINVDDWCIDLTPPEHQAQHGGGGWQLARKVAQGQPGAEWNAAIMDHLVKVEARKRALLRDPTAKLTPTEILAEGKLFMESRGVGAQQFRRYQR